MRITSQHVFLTFLCIIKKGYNKGMYYTVGTHVDLRPKGHQHTIQTRSTLYKPGTKILLNIAHEFSELHIIPRRTIAA